MQSKQKNAHTSKDEELDSRASRIKNKDELGIGYKAACMWKWARQDVMPWLKFKLPLERITAKRIYQDHKKAFDLLSKTFSDNSLSPLEYIRFFAIEHGGAEEKIDSEIADPKTLIAFETYQQSLAKKKQIYLWFMKSVNNIAEECAKNGWFTTKDFIRHLIDKKKLAGWYASGKISKYYLAAIPNFWKIVPKLDHFSRIELQPVADRYDMYNTEVNEAFLKLKKFKINPVALTDAMIYEKRHGIRP